MALNFADRLVSNNPSAYGIVRAIEVSGHKTVSSLSALYKIPDCILSDTGDNSGNDSLGQLWYVIDAKEVYQLVNWEKRNEAGGWKPYLSGVITDEALEEILNTKQDKLIAGEGISISEDNVISCTIDTSLFRMVDELPSLEEAETNKIYLLRKENNIGELQSYTEYIVTIKVDEEGKEIKEWEKIGEYDLSIELAPYLKIEDAEKTYVKKENIVDSFEGGDPKEQVLSAEKGKELKELVDSLEERKVDSVTATEGKGIIVEGTHNDPTIGVLRDPESEGFFTIEETGLKLSGVQYAIDEAVGELTDRVELESDVVYNINEIFPGEGKGENGDQWHIQYAAAKLDAFLPAEKKVPGIKVKFINLDGNWRTFTFNGGYFLDGRNWSYDITSNDFTELATENLPTATPESNGVMSKEDKAKLDGISETINKDVDDKIAEVKETIDNYTVNGYKISTNPSLDRNDIGLGNVTNDAQIKRSEMGVPKGVATLGEDGKVPESQLPDSVLGNVKYQGVWDAVNNVPKLELNDFDSNGHYYIAINKGSQFGYDFDPGDWVINSNGRWVKIDNVDSVKSVNGQIGIVELGIEDIPNLKETLDSKVTNDDFNRHLTDYKNPHKVTKDQVGLGNVDNTADKDKPVSDATQALIDQTRTVLENKISELQTNTEADLEVFRSEFENKLAELAAKEEADIVAVNNSLKEAKTELQNNIDNLASKTENDLTVAKKELDNKISELSTKTESDLSTLRADLESSISVTKTELEKSISELASKTENDLNTAKSELEKAISDLTAKEEADIVAVNNALSEAKKELENSISSLASKTENDLSLATKDLNNKISELATKTESDLSTLRADLESSISVTKTDLESKITELATKTDAKFQATDSKIEATKTELQTNIDNLSHRHDDDMKDIRREIEEATAGSNEALNTHIQDKSNPHQVTKEQVGLGNVTDDAQVKRSEMGMPEGVATLDATGKVPSSQLPSFVDDVIEVDSFDLLPETGEVGKIYVTKDTNLTYRWSGSQYVEISESLALGETSSTAYPGDKGKATTDKVNAHTSDYNNPHKVDKAQVGLGNVDNTADLDKPVSNATQELVDNTKKELEEKINNSGNDLQDNIDKIDERVTNIEDSIAQPGGLATLDDVGKVPLEQLPSLVDDVIEVDSFEHLPEAGEVGKIYVTKDTNLLYRWTGVKYVEVSESLHLGEVAGTAYPGDKGKATTDKVNSHISDYNNPHKVTAEQVGLGNVDNTSDINKPVSTAQQEALDAVKTELEEKINNSGSDLQGNIDKIDERVTNIENSVGAPDGIATLDATGKVPSSQLPSFVDDVIEVDSFDLLPETGETGKIYVTKDTNLLYRWTGVKYVEISESLALGETSSTAYPGDKGKATTDKVNAHTSDYNNPHKVTKEQIGLGNVDNTADLDKPVSNATQELVDNTKKELEEKINNSGSDLQGNIDKIDERVTNIEDSIAQPGGLATLDATGKVPSSQLPSFVDDVIEVDSFEHLPEAGEVGKIYVTKDTNLTYRWSGSQYVEISESLALGETSSTAYAGDKGKETTDKVNSHISDYNNPHKVTAEQVGLGNVDNTSDINKPVSTAQQEALDAVKTELEEKINNSENDLQDNIDKIDERVINIEDSIAQPGGLATLDATGKVPLEQLPSLVDDVIEVDSFDLLPETGETGKIYVTKDTNLLYRWTGVKYVEVSESLHLGETADTAYAGDKGKETTDKVNSHISDFNNPHKVDKAQVGLGNVDNTADLDKPVSNATQELVDNTKKELEEKINNSGNDLQDNIDKIDERVINIENSVGAPDGIATLDSEGKLEVSQIPNEALNVIEGKYMTETQFTDSEGVEFIPRHNTIYIDSIGGSNKLYRWDGFKYVEVSDSDNVTEAIDNHIKDFNNPHKVTAEQIGLGSVDNTADIDKPISTAVQEALDTVNTKVTEHTENKENPHGVTAEQIGLGNVDNTADYDKPVSKATQDEIDRIDGRIDTIDNSIGVPSGIATLDGNGKLTDSQIPDKTINVLVGKLMSETEFKDEEGNTYEPRTGVIYIDTVSGTEKIYRWNKYEYVEISNTELLEGALNSHVQDKNNPHQVTKEQIGLSEVTNDAQVKRSEMGTPEGVATLNENGKIPVEQLPGQVDEVFGIDRFVSTKTDIPSSRLVIGSTYYVEDEKKIYTAISETELDEGATLDKGVIYSNRETNIIYRWDGAELVEIGNPVHLGEVAETAYPGDKGKATTDKVNAHVADFENPHQVTKEQIGLGNVDNTSDADKPISSAVQEALDAVNKEVSEHKADKNNPHEVTKAQVGLGNVDNTADLDKPVSNATQELVDNTKKELDTKIDNHTSDFNNPHKVTKEQVGLGNVDNTADINKPVSVAQQALVDSTKAELKKDIGDIEKDVTNHIADKNNPHEVNKLQVGLGNVDNTSDINKPVSTAQQAALDKLKSDLESIIGSTGTDLSAHLKDFDNPHKVTKDQVGLGKVDNTADLEKPVSVATQEAINAVQSNLDKTNISLENHIADKKNPHEVTKEQVGLGNVDNTSDLDKPVSHYQQDALDELERRLQGSIDGSGSDLSAHISDFNNPHKVTKDQVGLGNVDNTADKDKPISDATQKALDSIKTETNTIIETHIADKNNPHEVTKEQIGLGEVTNDAQVKRSEMGVAGGVATLDQEGKVPSSQLPSFVDDVIEVDSYDNLPTTGEAGKIYVTKDTNLTYRWSGSRYIEISASLALGETSSTAYPGDKGKETTDKVNTHVADLNNPHQVTKEQVGLGNVDNTSDLDKPVSNATQELVDNTKKELEDLITSNEGGLDNHIKDFNNPHQVTAEQVGLGNVDNTSDKDKPLSDAAKEAINEVKTLITSSGTDLSNHIKDYTNPHRVTAEQVGLGNVNNTSDLDKPISNATQKELDKLDAKIDKINTDQGTDLSAHLRDFSNPHKVTKEQIGLGNVDNTADLDKPISTATQKAIDDAKAANNTALDNHANRTDNPHKVTKDQVGLGNVDNTADINKPVSVAQQNALDTLSNSLNTAINNHVGNTNNPHQVTKEQVGLGKVDNTSDLEKPISVATQNAISEVVSNLDKHIADKNNPHEVTKEQIGLGRVDNTSDLEKPISTATQVALDKKAELGPDGKIPESQLPERTMHSLFYKGTWDAERNLPTLANGDKAQDGDYYLVNNDGESFGYKFMVNDIIFNASGIWYRMMGSNKRDNPTEFKITKFTADRTLLERGESTEITLEWEYQLTPSGQINFQFIDTHDIPVEERTYKITATGGQTFTLRGSYLSEVATATLTIDTADKVYVGASSNSAPTDSDFIAMNSFFSFGDNEFPFTPIDCSGGKYIYVAIPTEEYSKYRIYCNNYPVDDVTVYSRRITNIFTGYTDYTITKLANLYHGILNIEVKLIDKR